VAQIDTVLLLEAIENPIRDALVPASTSQVCVGFGRPDLQDALTDLQNRDAERLAADGVLRPLSASGIAVECLCSRATMTGLIAPESLPAILPICFPFLAHVKPKSRRQYSFALSARAVIRAAFLFEDN
jgi:hypothetical protein